MSESTLLHRLVRLTAIPLAGVAVQLAAATYYVSTTGVDLPANGSISAPFRTIQYAVNAAVNPGDIVFIRGGSYNESVIINASGTLANPILVSGYQSEFAIIDGNWQLPLDPTPPFPSSNPDGVNFNPLVKIAGSHVTLSNLAVTRSRGRGVNIVGGSSNALVSGVDVSFCMQAGIITNSASNALVENCDVTQVACVNAPLTSEYTGYGIPDVPGKQWRGSGTNWPCALIAVDSTGCVFRGNRVYKVHGEGIADLRSSYSLFEDNVSYDAYKVMFYLDNSKYSTVRRNLVYATSDTTFWRPEKNQTWGGPVYSGPKPSPGIVFNAEHYASHAPHDPTGIKIYNNFVYNTGDGISVWGGQVSQGYEVSYSDITMAYNTVVNTLTGTVGTACNGVALFDGYASKTNLAFKNNIVRVDTGTLITGPTTGLTFSYNNWSAAVAGEYSGGSTDVIGDAHLQLGTGTPAADWFKFDSTSPCRNQAQVMTDVTTDYFGSPRGAAPDMGGYEYYLPATPTALTATAVSSSQINLTWSDNSVIETGYEIDRATNATFTAGLTTVTVAANVETYSSTGLTAGTTYYYRVRATNGDGDSGNSNTASATTLAGNLLANPGFENASLGSEWSQGIGTGSLVRTTTNQRTGSAALKATGAAAYAVRLQSVAVTANQTYTISGYLRVESPVSGNGFAIAYSWLNSSGATISQGWMGQTTATDGAYVLKSATAAAPTGAVTLQVRCVINSTAVGTAYFDDMSVTGP